MNVMLLSSVTKSSAKNFELWPHHKKLFRLRCQLKALESIMKSDFSHQTLI